MAAGSVASSSQIDPFAPAAAAPQTTDAIFRGAAGAPGAAAPAQNPQNPGATTAQPGEEFKTPEGGYFEGLFPN